MRQIILILLLLLKVGDNATFEIASTGWVQEVDYQVWSRGSMVASGSEKPNRTAVMTMKKYIHVFRCVKTGSKVKAIATTKHFIIM